MSHSCENKNKIKIGTENLTNDDTYIIIKSVHVAEYCDLHVSLNINTPVHIPYAMHATNVHIVVIIIYQFPSIIYLFT
jgi:hypothetical protein